MMALGAQGALKIEPAARPGDSGSAVAVSA